MATAIKVENLSKIYRLGEIGTGTISRDIERFVKTKIFKQEDPFLKIGETNDRATKGASDIVYSLKDINFEIEQGDAVGIIGRNGAGKSTLLKILSRVTSPTAGKINIKGRVASLLEVGTGFHPELTGRENIYLNGAILGMRKREIDRKLGEIIDFSGVERYIDTPVKRYSSGMYVRLAFAVAAHLESEILIVDEVLAVGDAEFQKKCLGKMGEVSKGEGRTVLFVSHNMGAVKSLCNKGYYLNNGFIAAKGELIKVINDYFSVKEKILPIMDPNICISEILINESNDSNIYNGVDLNFEIYFEIYNHYENIGFAIFLYGRDMELITIINTYHSRLSILKFIKKDKYCLSFAIPKYTLNDGLYRISLNFNTTSGEIISKFENIFEFSILDDNKRRGDRYLGAWPGYLSLLPEISIK
jgi:lipopolysaccharide transport system ATP-binding protein